MINKMISQKMFVLIVTLLFMLLFYSVSLAGEPWQSTSTEPVATYTNMNSSIITTLEANNNEYDVSTGIPTGEIVNYTVTAPAALYNIQVNKVTASAGVNNIELQATAEARYMQYEEQDQGNGQYVMVPTYYTVQYTANDTFSYSNSITAYEVEVSDIYPLTGVSTQWSLNDAYFTKSGSVDTGIESLSPQTLVPWTVTFEVETTSTGGVSGTFSSEAEAMVEARKAAEGLLQSMKNNIRSRVDASFGINGTVAYYFNGLFVTNDGIEGELQVDDLTFEFSGDRAINLSTQLQEGTYVGEGTATFGTTEVAFNPGNIVIKEDENSQGNVWCSGDYELVATYTNMDQPISITNYVDSEDFSTASGVPKGQTLNHVIEAPECLYNIAVYRANGRAGVENIPITVNANYTVEGNSYTISSTDTYTYTYTKSGYEVTTSDIRALKYIDSLWELNDDGHFYNSVSVDPISEPTAQTLSLYISKPAVQNKYVVNLNVGSFPTQGNGMIESQAAINRKIAEIKAQIKSIVDSSISISGTVDYSFKGLTVTKDNGPVGTPTITNVSRTVPFTIPTNIPTGTYVGSGGVTYGSASTELNPNNVVVTNMLGDMDGNNSHNIIDVRLLLQSIINYSSENPYAVADMIPMDFDANGEINIVDVRLLLQHVINQG